MTTITPPVQPPVSGFVVRVGRDGWLTPLGTVSLRLEDARLFPTAHVACCCAKGHAVYSLGAARDALAREQHEREAG